MPASSFSRSQGLGFFGAKGSSLGRGSMAGAGLGAGFFSGFWAGGSCMPRVYTPPQSMFIAINSLVAE